MSICKHHLVQMTAAFCLLVATLLFSSAAAAASKLEIDTGVQATLERLYTQRSEARALAAKADAILVFPRILKAGIGIGGEIGEGALLVNNETSGYYRVTSLSVGFQLGGQAMSQVIMFMTEEAKRSFVESDGWEAGVDGSVALIEFGVGAEVDTNSIQDPIIAFVLDNKGLMYNLSIEGSKFWKIVK